MPEIFVLGSACGFPIPGRGHSSLLFSISGKSILVDAGEPCSRSLIEAGIPLNSIEGILLTHGHADHIGGLPMLIQTLWLTNRTKAFTIFLPEELSKPLQQWLDAIYLGPRFIPFGLNFVPWVQGETFEAFGLQIRPFETTHLQSLAKKFGSGRFKSYSLKVEHTDFCLVFSGDLGSPKDLLTQLSEPVDLLVSELAHFPPGELFQLLATQKIRTLLLTHFAPELLGKEDSILEEAKGTLPGISVFIAHDGLKLPLLTVR
jgi:ribonuclease BN (tRNA processing enzyme)